MSRREVFNGAITPLAASAVAIAFDGGSREAIAGPSAGLPVAVLAAAPDPVLALAEAERQAWEAFGDACYVEDRADGGEEHKAALALWNGAHSAWTEAVARLVTTVPTTTEGLLVMLDRFEAYTDGCMIGDADDGFPDLIATIRAFVSGRA